MIKGVTGKILWVDLSAGTCVEERVPEEVYEHYLAGIGLAAYYLYKRIPVGADPLGPENVLAFVPGLLTGTGSMMTGRWMVAGKSPLTQTWGDANCGGTFAPTIKQCGYDGIFFVGKSEKPVYLSVSAVGIELKDASELWGKDTRETEALIQAAAEKRKPQVVCIGPAGEKLSLIAGVSNDQGRMAARSGLGAVMGSKKLKAIALNGTQRIEAADREQMKALTQGFMKHAKFKPNLPSGKFMRFLGKMMAFLPLAMRQDGMLYKIMLQKWGTISMNEFSIVTGDAPIKNWAGSDKDFTGKLSASINPDVIRELELKRYHCYSCPIGCGGYCRMSDGGETHKPEYETILALGGLLMNRDLDSLMVMNEKLNRAGMDSISAGGTVAMAIEAFENGKLTLEDTGGIELRWGNAAAAEALIDLMIERRGLGDILADGAKAAAEKLNKACEEYAIHAGGQEPAMHDGRADPGFALHYAVEPTPGRHTIGSILYYEMFQMWRKSQKVPKPSPIFYPKKWKYRGDKNNAGIAVANSKMKMIMDGAGLCLFGAFIGVHRLPIFEWLNAATGWNKTPDDYLDMGRNIQTLRQAFNQKHGAPLRHEMSNRLIGKPPLREGANKGWSVPIEELVPLYWQGMGWNPDNGRVAEADVALEGL